MVIRDDIVNPTNSYVEDANSDYNDVDNKSEVSDCTFTKSVGSSSSNHLDDTFHPGDQGSRVCLPKPVSCVLFAVDC